MRRVLPVVMTLLFGIVGVNAIAVSNMDTPKATVSQGKETPESTPPPEVKLPDLLLPDMQIAAPKELYVSTRGGVREIRFSTTFSNIGEGPMELIGETDEEQGVTIATQRVKKADGGTEDMVIGEFVYHPGHGHWHVDKYGLFQLFKYDKNRGPTEIVASTDKFSFCLWDEHPYDLSLPNALKTRQYPRCPRNVQGNSVGWGDTYTANIEGQGVDITGVPDGLYMVRSVVNANNSILESNYGNNEAILYIELTGNSLRVLEPSER